MTDTSDADAASAAERRLRVYLSSLQTHAPQAPQGFADGVVRTARWQAAARPYLHVAGGFGQAVVTAVHVLLEPRRTQ